MPVCIDTFHYQNPDFAVRNIRTGNLFYWEHLGMLDDGQYCADNQVKMENYAEYGYFPGKNLLITFESSKRPLNEQYVDKLIGEFLK